MATWLSRLRKRYERATALFIAALLATAVLATLYVFYGSWRVGIVLASLVIAVALFWLRKIARGLYGAIEVLIGFVAILDASTKGRGGFSAGFSAGFQRYDWAVILLQTAAAIYLMICGFDNLDQWWSDKRSERRVRHMAFVRSIFDGIDANLRSLDIDEIKKKLEPLKTGYSIQSPIFEPGAFLYRARLIAPTFNKTDGIMRKDLIYPPANVAPLGRLNRAGQPVFYCSMHKESVFFELPDLKAGDELILTFWKTNEKMFVNNIGYTEYVFRQFGAKRSVPQWNPQSAKRKSDRETIALVELPLEVVQTLLSEDDRREIHEAFSKYFTQPVSLQENYRYKLTTAIGELHLGTITTKDQETRFAGILYPSTRMWANGDNVAVLPWFVDAHLTFRKALHIRIDSRTDTSISITYLDSAKEFDSNGKLIWFGKPSHWSVRPGQKAKFTAVAGVDDDGDYQMSTDGHSYHWTATDCDTGEPIEAR